MYQTQLDCLYNRATAIYLSAPADHDSTYQPGETLYIIADNSAGRVLVSVSDHTKQFYRYTVQRKWDEGILFVTAYRV